MRKQITVEPNKEELKSFLLEVGEEFTETDDLIEKVKEAILENFEEDFWTTSDAILTLSKTIWHVSDNKIWLTRKQSLEEAKKESLDKIEKIKSVLEKLEKEHYENFNRE